MYKIQVLRYLLLETTYGSYVTYYELRNPDLHVCSTHMLVVVLQLLFGIKGKRWDDANGKLLYNEHWVRPLSSDRPPGAGEVEGGAYW